MNIRLVRPEDSEAVRAIYAQYIHTPITFECTLPSQQAFAQRIAGICGDYPYLVCAEGDAVVGYAYAHRQMEREAYQWNAELSVYLDERHTSRGWGKSLYTALMGLLALQGIKTVYAGVTIPNEKSEGLHASMGFSRLGTYHRTGFKNGQWHDVAWFEKAIAPYEADPMQPIPFSAVPEDKIKTVLFPYEKARP